MKKLIICIISIIAIIHSANTIMYNLPENPYQEKHSKYSNYYMMPLFEQNWNLFAPTPVITNNYINVRYADSEEELEKSKWTNLTKYYQSDFRHRYLHTSFYKNTVITQLESDILEAIELKNDKKISKKMLKNDKNVKDLYKFVYRELAKNSVNPNYMEITYEIEYLPAVGDKKSKSEIRVEKLPIYETKDWSKYSEND